MKVEFPKWVYNEKGESQLVNTKEEQESLGDAWKESPADFKDQPKKEADKPERDLDDMLKAEGISVYHTYVGEFATSMEMAGASISLLKLDDELKRLLAKPANTPFFEQVQL